MFTRSLLFRVGGFDAVVDSILQLARAILIAEEEREVFKFQMITVTAICRRALQFAVEHEFSLAH